MNLYQELKDTTRLLLDDFDISEADALKIAVEFQRNEIMAKPQPQSLADARIEQANKETIERLMRAHY